MTTWLMSGKGQSSASCQFVWDVLLVAQLRRSTNSILLSGKDFVTTGNCNDSLSRSIYRLYLLICDSHYLSLIDPLVEAAANLTKVATEFHKSLDKINRNE